MGRSPARTGVQPHVTDSDSVEEFAALLLSMKEQSGRTYEALAKRAGTSRSALHRYCSGQTVPAEFAVLERLGRTMGADRETLLDLHRRWAVAAAVRRSVAGQAVAGQSAPGSGRRPAQEVPPPVGALPAAGRPRRNRWRAALVTATAVAVAAGLRSGVRRWSRRTAARGPAPRPARIHDPERATRR